VRGAQHDVRRGRRTRARDRDDARHRLPRPAGGAGGDAGDDAAGPARRRARRTGGVGDLQRIQRQHPGQQLQPGGVPVQGLARAAVDGTEVGAGHRPGRRPVPRPARSAPAGDHGPARRVTTLRAAGAIAAALAGLLAGGCTSLGERIAQPHSTGLLDADLLAQMESTAGVESWRFRTPGGATLAYQVVAPATRDLTYTISRGDGSMTFATRFGEESRTLQTVG